MCVLKVSEMVIVCLCVFCVMLEEAFNAHSTGWVVGVYSEGCAAHH